MSEKDKLTNMRYLRKLIQSLYQEFPAELMEILQETNWTPPPEGEVPDFYQGDVVEVRNSPDEVWRLDRFTGISVTNEDFPFVTSRRLSDLTLFGCKSLDDDQLSLSKSLIIGDIENRL